ncbi:MAG: hypothetical protein L6Q97_13385 [Thermoanaerobaculia bacterium]|nr:hypothetical protein [Thermoanaerobaculia bacterium]
MQDSTLIRTLQLLNQEEFDTLELFVASPIFNEVNRFNDTVRLFEYLKEYYPHFQDPALDKNTTGKALYPKRSNPAGEVEKSMAQLMHIVRQFINFRYTAVKGGRVVRGGRKTAFLHDPVALLNFARQQLALMRFYSERLHQKSNEPGTETVSPPKTAAEEGKKKRAKRAEHFFQNLYNELEEVFDSQQEFNHFAEYEYSDFFYFRYLSEQEKALYESLHEWSAQGGFLSLLETTEKLDRFFLLSKLDQICKLLHLQQLAKPFGEDTDEYRRLLTNQNLTVKMAKLLAQNQYDKDDPSILLYFTLLKLLTKKKPEKTDALADTFFELLRQHRSILPAKRLADFLVIVRSYWVRRYRQTRDRQFLERQFRSHQEDIEQLRREDRDIRSSHFQNILSNAVRLGHLEWAETFLNQFSQRITATPEPEIVADVGQALLRFAQKRYAEAGKILPHYFTYGATDDINLYLVAATLDVRIRYELDTLLDEDSVNMRRATQKRIRENKTMRPERKAGVLAFYEHAVNLFRHKEKKQYRQADPAILLREADKIETALKATPAADAEWLLEKCRELRGDIPGAGGEGVAM